MAHTKILLATAVLFNFTIVGFQSAKAENGNALSSEYIDRVCKEEAQALIQWKNLSEGNHIEIKSSKEAAAPLEMKKRFQTIIFEPNQASNY